MPPIVAVSSTPGALTIAMAGGISHVVTDALIPAQDNTIALAEAWINGTWVPSITGGAYQIAVHVISLAPLVATVMVADANVTIPDNWWQQYG